jgi:hypothetical protein
MYKPDAEFAAIHVENGALPCQKTMGDINLMLTKCYILDCRGFANGRL